MWAVRPDGKISAHRTRELAGCAKPDAETALPRLEDRLGAVVAVKCPRHLALRHAPPLVCKLNTDKAAFAEEPDAHWAKRKRIFEVVADQVPQYLHDERFVPHRHKIGDRPRKRAIFQGFRGACPHTDGNVRPVRDVADILTEERIRLFIALYEVDFVPLRLGALPSEP